MTNRPFSSEEKGEIKAGIGALVIGVFFLAMQVYSWFIVGSRRIYLTPLIVAPIFIVVGIYKLIKGLNK